MQVDLANQDSIKNALIGKGFDVVVHLAAALEDSSIEAIRSCNITGSKNLLDACVAAGIRKVVYTSSVMVMFGYRFIQPYQNVHAGNFSVVKLPLPEITPFSDPLLPNQSNSSNSIVEYAKSKMFTEHLGKEYSEKYGINFLCIRLGWINEADSPFPQNESSCTIPAPNWISQRDAIQLINLCAQSKHITYAIYYGVSDYRYRYFSLENAKKDLGYVPMDDITKKIDEHCRPLLTNNN